MHALKSGEKNKIRGRGHIVVPSIFLQELVSQKDHPLLHGHKIIYYGLVILVNNVAGLNCMLCNRSKYKYLHQCFVRPRQEPVYRSTIHNSRKVPYGLSEIISNGTHA